MLEEYISKIAFAMTAIIIVFISDFLFTGTRGGVKTFLSGYHWSTKKKGFVIFLVSIVIIIPLVAIFFQGIMENFLNQQKENLLWILLIFFGVCFLYFNKKYYNNWF